MCNRRSGFFAVSHFPLMAGSNSVALDTVGTACDHVIFAFLGHISSLKCRYPPCVLPWTIWAADLRVGCWGFL